MNVRELEAHAKALAPVVRGFVSKAVDALRCELSDTITAAVELLRADVAKSIESIPTIDVQDIAKQAAVLVEVNHGKDGQSVTLEDVQPMIDEATVKAVSELPVPKDGQPGEPGKDGQSVTLEDLQPLIDDAVSKAIGKIEIIAPEDGKPGRDALEIDLLASIDEAKTYQRGTWATHNGGIWRAHATTEGMRGWECVVDGLHECSVEQVDARNFVSVLEMASGKVTRKEMVMPTMVYRNVFRGGEKYQQGDVVSFGGSLWHCNEDTDTKPGDGQKCWTLCAKKGRDGKSS